MATTIALLALAGAARADEPDPAIAVVVGAGTNLAGFIVGGAVLTSGRTNGAVNAGWLTIEGAFTASPLAAHAVSGEWGRGALFSIVPAGCMAGTATLFGLVPGVVDQGSLPQQRLMWGLFVAGQLASAVGIVDAAFAPLRRNKLFLAPAIGGGQVGLELGGLL